MPETVKDGRDVDGVDGVRDRMDWKGRRVMGCAGKAWNMVEGPEMVPE
jgi:hypothetical protein